MFHYQMTQRNIIRNYNLLVDSLSSDQFLNQLKGLTKLNKDGECRGFTAARMLYGRESQEKLKEFMLCLRFVNDLDGQEKITQFVEAYKTRRMMTLKTTPTDRGICVSKASKVIEFLKTVSICQNDQSYRQLGANWDRVYAFICHHEQLIHHVNRANIQAGDMVFFSMGKHVFYVERTRHGFYLFESNYINNTAIDNTLIINEDMLVEEIIKNEKMMMSENGLVTFSLHFLSYGNKNRVINDAIDELKQAFEQDKETMGMACWPVIVKRMNSLIADCKIKKISRLDCAFALCDIINEFRNEKGNMPGYLSHFDNIMKKYIVLTIGNQDVIPGLQPAIARCKKLDEKLYPELYSLIDQYENSKISHVDVAFNLLDIIATGKNNELPSDKILTKCVNQLDQYLNDEAKKFDINNGYLDRTIEICKNHITSAAYFFNSSLLYLTAQYNQITLLKKLIASKVDLDISNRNGATPLYMAAQNGHVEIVKLLLENKASPHVVDKDGATPLYMAAQNGHVEIVKLLLENKASLHVVNKNGATPLRMAVQKGHVEIVKLLLENNSSPHVATEDGASPLHCATQCGHAHIIDLLITHGASVNAAFTATKNVLVDYAKKKNKEGDLKKLFQSEKISGFTALHLAVFFGHTGIVEKLLVVPGINIDQKAEGVCPLYLAEVMGDSGIIHLLKEKKPSQQYNL